MTPLTICNKYFALCHYNFHQINGKFKFLLDISFQNFLNIEFDGNSNTKG